ncbi:pyocin activator PrtN family protein [Endozoicomonas sp. ALC066]|uniref:pyocin activator PrtN family protein n=1 Tax=Endozoicomonas sp. ALC066 TaxID=3403078 RepID=UPI003BB66638
MKTLTALLLTFDCPIVPLEDVCEKYFGLTYKKALEKVALGELEIPVFRLHESRKCPPSIHLADLAERIDTLREEQKKELKLF